MNGDNPKKVTKHAKPAPPLTVGRWLVDHYLSWQQESGGMRTLAEFAEHLSANRRKISVSRPALSMWINDKRRPTGVYVEILAEMLGPKIWDLLKLARPYASRTPAKVVSVNGKTIQVEVDDPSQFRPGLPVVIEVS